MSSSTSAITSQSSTNSTLYIALEDSTSLLDDLVKIVIAYAGQIDFSLIRKSYGSTGEETVRKMQNSLSSHFLALINDSDSETFVVLGSKNFKKEEVEKIFAKNLYDAWKPELLTDKAKDGDYLVKLGVVIYQNYNKSSRSLTLKKSKETTEEPEEEKAVPSRISENTYANSYEITIELGEDIHEHPAEFEITCPKRDRRSPQSCVRTIARTTRSERFAEPERTSKIKIIPDGPF